MLGNSKCVKDKVNQIGWAITAELPSKAPTSATKAVVRNQISRYVYIKKGCNEGK